MSPQGITRKRPASGKCPAFRPSLDPLLNYPQASGSPLPDNRFLHRGRNATCNTGPAAASPDANYDTAALPPAHDVSCASTSSNQLKQRQLNHVLVQSRSREPPSTLHEQGCDPNESEVSSASLDELYQRSLAAKRDAQAKQKRIPPFVQKLRSLLDKSKYADLIRWSDTGDSFIILNEVEFARSLIPKLFKHNNYASFVRQLHMYRFCKKLDISNNSMRASGRKNKSTSEYANPYFRRDHPDLLWLIQTPKFAARRRTKTNEGCMCVNIKDSGNEADVDSDDAETFQEKILYNRVPDRFMNMYQDLQAIHQHQQTVSITVNKLKEEHEQLYAQAGNFQEQHIRHENAINTILSFLTTVHNRNLQGQEDQILSGPLARAISQDHHWCNGIDIGNDYRPGPLSTPSTNGPGEPPSMKKHPLLRKAPPVSGRNGLGTVLSPAASAYNYSQSRSGLRWPNASQLGQFEKVLDTSQRSNDVPASSRPQQYPQGDTVSSIQNARYEMPITYGNYSNVLSPFERSGGNSPPTFKSTCQYALYHGERVRYDQQ